MVNWLGVFARTCGVIMCIHVCARYLIPNNGLVYRREIRFVRLYNVVTAANIMNIIKERVINYRCD